MKSAMRLVAILFMLGALILGLKTYNDGKNEGELVKAFRDPDRVDQRWLYVTGLATAGVCLGLWATYKKQRAS